METRKLYYEDCMLREFTATVTDCQETDKGYLIALDATAFYPEGGGQACDTGTLNDATVSDVRENGETVLHLCNKPLTPGTHVTGKIDWTRRFDLMQQHTGEHIVSGIIHKLFGGHNVGFHMGADVVTMDFDVIIPAEALADIERKANQAIFENLPVNCWIPSPEELPNVFYRTKRALPWPVRIVEVPGYDSCACCGVHTAYTGQLGLIKLLSCVKFHEGVRMEMVCGGRALAYFDAIFRQNKLVSQAFSAKLMETGAAAARMNEQLANEKYRATQLEKQLYSLLAERYVNCGDVLYFAEGFSPAATRELAEQIAKQCGGTAAVFSGTDKDGYTVCLVNKVSDIAQLGKNLNQALNGRGGGKPGFFQGSVKATRSQIEAFFAE